MYWLLSTRPCRVPSVGVPKVVDMYLLFMVICSVVIVIFVVESSFHLVVALLWFDLEWLSWNSTVKARDRLRRRCLGGLIDRSIEDGCIVHILQLRPKCNWYLGCMSGGRKMTVALFAYKRLTG